MYVCVCMCVCACVCLYVLVMSGLHLHTRYILDLTKDQKAQFVARSTELATNAGLKVKSSPTFAKPRSN